MAKKKVIEVSVAEMAGLPRSEALGDRRYQENKLAANAIKLIPKLEPIADENDKTCRVPSAQYKPN